MKQTITFRTEIAFQGSIQEFGKLVSVLKGSPVVMRAEWPPDHPDGCWPTPVAEIVNARVLAKTIEGMPRIAAEIIQGINGGIREAHLHVGGDVVLLDRESFKVVVQEAATELAGGLAEQADYTEIVGAIRNLAP
jgi:hypothetical protein